MARVTIEDCMESIHNRFVLVNMVKIRTQQLLKGAKPLVETDNREVVNALREIAASKVVLDQETKEDLQKDGCIGFEEDMDITI